MASETIKKRLKRIKHAAQKDHVDFRDYVIPAKHLRSYGEEFQSKEIFLESAAAEAKRLVNRCGFTNNTKLLDVGCGPGRLPIGILQVLPELESYLGLDVDKQSIEWCEKYIGEEHEKFKFIHLDAANERYNPEGEEITEGFTFPIAKDSIDVVYLLSVFSHMAVSDIRIYTNEFHRILAPGGRVFLTAFVEEDVPDMTVNPEGYRMKYSGPLHVVRYEKSHFLEILSGAGFDIDRVDQGVEVDNQTGIYLTAK